MFVIFNNKIIINIIIFQGNIKRGVLLDILLDQIITVSIEKVCYISWLCHMICLYHMFIYHMMYHIRLIPILSSNRPHPESCPSFLFFPHTDHIRLVPNCKCYPEWWKSDKCFISEHASSIFILILINSVIKTQVSVNLFIHN